MIITTTIAFSLLFASPTTPLCEEEDGSEMLYSAKYEACKWDAGSEGNGVGTSFVVVKDHASKTLYYIYKDGHVESGDNNDLWVDVSIEGGHIKVVEAHIPDGRGHHIDSLFDL